MSSNRTKICIVIEDEFYFIINSKVNENIRPHFCNDRQLNDEHFIHFLDDKKDF